MGVCGMTLLCVTGSQVYAFKKYLETFRLWNHDCQDVYWCLLNGTVHGVLIVGCTHG